MAQRKQANDRELFRIPALKIIDKSAMIKISGGAASGLPIYFYTRYYAERIDIGAEESAGSSGQTSL